MVDHAKADTVISAEGVDEETHTSTTAGCSGHGLYLVVAALAAIYAGFHLAATEGGLSIARWTGISIPHSCHACRWRTWNFRIVHVAGALGLGIRGCSRRREPSRAKRYGARRARWMRWAEVLMVPAVFSLGVALMRSPDPDRAAGSCGTGLDGHPFKIPARSGSSELRLPRRHWWAPIVALVVPYARSRADDRAGYSSCRVRLSRWRPYLITDLRHLDAQLDRARPFAQIRDSSLAAISRTLPHHWIFTRGSPASRFVPAICSVVFLAYVFHSRPVFCPGFLRGAAVDLAALLQPRIITPGTRSASSADDGAVVVDTKSILFIRLRGSFLQAPRGDGRVVSSTLLSRLARPLPRRPGQGRGVRVTA